MSEVVTTAELGELVLKRRNDRRMSLRDVADETGVSASTLSRCENGQGELDTTKVIALTRWLDIPVQRVDEGKLIYFETEPLPQIVSALITRDKKLTREEGRSLSRIFEIAYNEMVRT